jgi:hypothetical protein
VTSLDSIVAQFSDDIQLMLARRLLSVGVLWPPLAARTAHSNTRAASDQILPFTCGHGLIQLHYHFQATDSTTGIPTGPRKATSLRRHSSTNPWLW